MINFGTYMLSTSIYKNVGVTRNQVDKIQRESGSIIMIVLPMDPLSGYEGATLFGLDTRTAARVPSTPPK